MEITYNCLLCGYYQCEEIGDSDYGAIYAETPTCEQFNDCDENENPIEDFDRNRERDCCSLDFWKVLEHDEELKAIFDKEYDDEDMRFELSYKRFKEKYS